MKLSEKLIELRKRKAWSQEEFAEKLDVSRQAISRWENGTALPDAQNLLAISKLFDVSADYLLNDDYESDVRTAAAITPKEETEPSVQNKKRLYLYLISAICFVILAVCVIMAVAMRTDDRADEASDHPVLKSVRENDVAPTCTAQGSYDEVVYCTECGEEVLRTTQSVAKLSHALSGSVKTDVTAPTCIAEGSYDEVVYCTVCDEEILRTRRSTAMVAHQFESRKCIVCGKVQPSEGLFFMSDGKGTCIVDIGDCVDEDIVIPEYSPSGDKVTQIKALAFSERNHVKSIYIPETVTFIGEGAFANCTNLESVNLPSNVTMINSYTFDGCKNLKEITLPAGVYYIGEKAFAQCLALESIVIPAGVTKIGAYAFENFSGGDGTITFEIYDGWEVYDSEDVFAAEVDFTSGSATPTEYLIFRFPEYVWKRT